MPTLRASLPTCTIVDVPAARARSIGARPELVSAARSTRSGRHILGASSMPGLHGADNTREGEEDEE